MAGTGGAREGAGRKPKADEEKVNNLFVNALKELYDKESDDEAKTEFIKDLLSNQRGQLFVAEHIFGKAPQEIKQTNFNIDEKDLTPELIKEIKTIIETKY